MEPAKETGPRFEDEKRRQDSNGYPRRSIGSPKCGFGLNGGAALELADERHVRLEQLGDAANLDIKALTGRSSWLKMRVGDWRVVYRPADPGPGRFVARVVNRRDLDATVKQL